MNEEEYIKKIIKKYTKKYFSVVMGLFILAATFNLFFAPTNIAYGETNGLAVVLQNAFKIKLKLMVEIISFVCLILGFIFLNKKTISKAIVGSVLYPLFILITANISDYIFIDYSRNLLLIYTFGAILLGFGAGLVYKKGFSAGGLNILKQIFYEKFGLSMGRCTLIFNVIIVISGAIITDSYSNIMYAIIIIYVYSYVTDRVILGISEQKAFQIVTKKENEIKKFIIEQLGHKVTIFNVQGGYLNKSENILLCIIPTKEYFITKEAIKTIDKDAFFVVSDTYEEINEK